MTVVEGPARVSDCFTVGCTNQMGSYCSTTGLLNCWCASWLNKNNPPILIHSNSIGWTITWSSHCHNNINAYSEPIVCMCTQWDGECGNRYHKHSHLGRYKEGTAADSSPLHVTLPTYHLRNTKCMHTCIHTHIHERARAHTHTHSTTYKVGGHYTGSHLPEAASLLLPKYALRSGQGLPMWRN